MDAVIIRNRNYIYNISGKIDLDSTVWIIMETKAAVPIGLYSTWCSALISNMSCPAGTGTVFQLMCPGSSRAAVVTASPPVMGPLTWEMRLRTRRCRETPEPAPPCC